MKNKFLNIFSSGFSLKPKIQIPKLLLLFLFLALSGFSFAQVQIEEEVVLNELVKVESVENLMPYYGRAEYQLIDGAFTGFGVKKVIVDINGHHGEYGGGYCSWQPTTYHVGEVAVDDVPKDAYLGFVVVRCTTINGVAVLVQAPSRIVNIPNNQRMVQAQLLNSTVWRDVARLTFTEQTPPDCINANYYCTAFTSSLPQIQPQNMVGIYTSRTGCSKPKTVAFFDAVSLKNEKGRTALRSSHFTFDRGYVDVCFDKQRQIWNFRIMEPNIVFPYVIEFCYDYLHTLNLNLIDINGIMSLPASKCSLLLASYYGHKEYPRKVPENGYIFYEVNQSHEQAHRQLWLDYINEYLSISGYNDFLNNYNFGLHCNDITDIEIAKEKFLNDFRNFFENEFFYPMYKKYEKESGQLNGETDQIEKHGLEETRAENDPLVQAFLFEIRVIILLKCWI